MIFIKIHYFLNMNIKFKAIIILIHLWLISHDYIYKKNMLIKEFQFFIVKIQ